VTLTLEQLRAASARCKTWRHKPLLALLVWTGMRRDEVRRLTWEDIDKVEQTMIFVGKQGKRRTVPIHPALWEALGAAPTLDMHLRQRKVWMGASDAKVSRLSGVAVCGREANSGACLARHDLSCLGVREAILHLISREFARRARALSRPAYGPRVSVGRRAPGTVSRPTFRLRPTSPRQAAGVRSSLRR
jgi:integrase